MACRLEMERPEVDAFRSLRSQYPMHGFNRPLGPIGSNVVAPPLQTTSSGMMVTANRIVPGQEVIDFKGYFKVETYPHNSVIYRPGDTADRVFLLKSGRVRLMRLGKNSQRSVVSILRPGDLFGELFRPEGTTIEEKIGRASCRERE